MNWAQKYWDTIDQLWWSPNMLGLTSISKKKWDICGDSILIPKAEVPSNASIYTRTSSVGTSIERMRMLEEPLNHIFDITFAIAPCSVIQRFFIAPLGISDHGPFMRLGREVRTRYSEGLRDVTQQDGYYVSENSLVGVEIKTGSKTSVEQVLKYLALMIGEEEQSFKRRNLGLLFITPDSTEKSVFRHGGVQTDGTLCQDFIQASLPSVRNKKLKKHMEEMLSSYEDAAHRLKVAHMSWGELLELIDATIFACRVPESRDETLERLLMGFATAIREHGRTLPASETM